MPRRFEVGPILVALGAIVLLVSLFMDWYGPLTAWEAFEVVEVLLAVLALAALATAAGQLVPEIEYVERRWLPVIVFGISVLVAVELVDPPPAVGEDTLEEGAWLALGAALVMLAGAVLTFASVSLAIAVQGRDQHQRVVVVDHRQDTTETAPITPTEPKRAEEG
jgi:hypothetical protein